MKKFFFTLIALLYLSGIFGQTAQTKELYPKGLNKIYLEIGGQGQYYSLNFEHIIETSSAWYPSLKIGASYFDSFVIPVGLDVNKRITEKSQFSFGLGGTMIVGSYKYGVLGQTGSPFHNVFTTSDYWAFFKGGYQYSKVENNWFFGLAFMPVFYSYEAAMEVSLNSILLEGFRLDAIYKIIHCENV